MNNHELEEFIIEKCLNFGKREQVEDIITHFRLLNLNKLFLTFLLNEGILMWYILNTYEWMCYLREKGILLNSFYSQNKTPKSNFVPTESSYPTNLTKLQNYEFWTNMHHKYVYYLKQIIDTNQKKLHK